jgi:ABC-type glutathione transport system ATPase component
MADLIEVRDLGVTFGAGRASASEAVAGISFSIAPGEFVGLLGESGCGKSTTALALLGLLAREHASVRGSVIFEGQDLLRLGERELQNIRGDRISIVFQEPELALSPVMRAGDQIAEVIHAHRDWNWRRCRTEAEGLLDRLGLKPKDRIYSAYPHQLSGGQRQRVALAQALACQPALLIADEPTASLDAQSQAGFVALLRELKQDSRTSLLLISHTPEVEASLADRVLIMKQGSIIECGDAAHIYRHSQNAYTRGLLGAHGSEPALAREVPAEELMPQ